MLDHIPCKPVEYMTDNCPEKLANGEPFKVTELDSRGLREFQKALERAPNPFAVIDTEGFCERKYAFNRNSPKHLAVKWVSIYVHTQVVYIRFSRSTEEAIAQFLNADFKKIFWGISEDAKRLPPIRNAQDAQVMYAQERKSGKSKTGLARAVNGLQRFRGKKVFKTPFHLDKTQRGSFYRGFIRDTLTPLHIKYMVADVWFIWLVTRDILIGASKASE